MQKITDLLQAALANPNRAPEYARQILAMTGPAAMPLSARSQMRPRASDLEHSPALVPTVQPTLAPSRWIELTGIPLLHPQDEWDSGRIQFQFSPGFLIGWRGEVLRLTYDQGGNFNGYTASGVELRLLGVKLSFNGGEPLITDGQNETWGWYSDLFGWAGMEAPMLRRVEQSDTLNVSFYNSSPAALTKWDLLPSLRFAFLADRDLPDLLLAEESK